MHDASPRWIVVGAVLLTFITGSVNAVGLLGVFHGATTHVTGTVTSGALALQQGNVDDALRAAGVVAAFFAGALCSGLIVGSPEVRRGRRYGWALVLEALLLLVAWGLFARGHTAAVALAAMSAGLQNGMLTTWSGAVLRTSHLTGVVTDLGVNLAFALRGNDRRRELKVHAALLSGFFLGGVATSALWATLGYGVLAVPVVLCLLAASGASILRQQA
jgi:uncharacterized membrane protein YoaK (UPF0700 family)